MNGVLITVEVRNVDEGILEQVQLPTRDVGPFIELLRVLGYRSKEGSEYRFEDARVEPSLRVCVEITLSPEED